MDRRQLHHGNCCNSKDWKGREKGQFFTYADIDLIITMCLQLGQVFMAWTKKSFGIVHSPNYTQRSL